MNCLIFVLCLSAVTLANNVKIVPISKYKLLNNTKLSKHFDTLTNIEKSKMCLLGRQLAYDYIKTKDFLPKNYDSRIIRVNISGSHSSIEAVQSLLHGLYSFDTDLHLNSDQFVTTVHTGNDERDYFFFDNALIKKKAVV